MYGYIWKSSLLELVISLVHIIAPLVIRVNDKYPNTPPTLDMGRNIYVGGWHPLIIGRVDARASLSVSWCNYIAIAWYRTVV